MKKIAAIFFVGMIWTTWNVKADESLWCQVKHGTIAGTAHAGAGKVTPFAWASSHGAGNHSTGPIKTSIGLIKPGDTVTRITLDGKAVPLPAAAKGPIWSGKVFDLVGSIAIAFLVEGPNDSSASPSEALLVIKPGPIVVASDVISGDQVSYDTKPCDLGLLN